MRVRMMRLGGRVPGWLGGQVGAWSGAREDGSPILEVTMGRVSERAGCCSHDTQGGRFRVGSCLVQYKAKGPAKIQLND